MSPSHSKWNRAGITRITYLANDLAKAPPAERTRWRPSWALHPECVALAAGRAGRLLNGVARHASQATSAAVPACQKLVMAMPVASAKPVAPSVNERNGGLLPFALRAKASMRAVLSSGPRVPEDFTIA